MAHFKLSAVAFAPLGKRAVPSLMADEAEKRAAARVLDARLAAARPARPPEQNFATLAGRP